MTAPELPTWQDCHELWSKKRRRQIRDQEASAQPSKPTSANSSSASAITTGSSSTVSTTTTNAVSSFTSISTTVANKSGAMKAESGNADVCGYV